MNKIKSALVVAGSTVTWGALNLFNSTYATDRTKDAIHSAQEGLGMKDENGKEIDPGDLTSSIRTVFTFIFSVLGIVAVVVIVLGGFYFLTSTGDPAKIKKGKDTILWGIVGLVVCLFAFAIVNFILGALGA